MQLIKEQLSGGLITLCDYGTYISACGSFQPYDKSINKIQDALNLEVEKKIIKYQNN